VPKVVLYNDGAPNSPYFPSEFELVYYQTLQWTDVKKNHNKYYVLEFHKGTEGGKSYFRLYTHYGRTDDLVTKPHSGKRECRYYQTENDAENAFAAILNEKTDKKGYRPVDLVFSNIGSAALKKLGESLHQDDSEEEGGRPTESDIEPQVSYYFEIVRYQDSNYILASGSHLVLI
jgi:predicted DNA-binding WGR domain protein